MWVFKGAPISFIITPLKLFVMKSCVVKPPGGRRHAPIWEAFAHQRLVSFPFHASSSLMWSQTNMPQLHRRLFNARQSGCISLTRLVGDEAVKPAALPSQLIHSDPTNCCSDHFCAILRSTTSPGIHVNNVPIVADGVHVEVGVGFPCLDCAFLTSCTDLQQIPNDVPTWSPTGFTGGPPQLWPVQSVVLIRTLCQICWYMLQLVQIISSQALKWTM